MSSDQNGNQRGSAHPWAGSDVIGRSVIEFVEEEPGSFVESVARSAPHVTQ